MTEESRVIVGNGYTGHASLFSVTRETAAIQIYFLYPQHV